MTNYIVSNVVPFGCKGNGGDSHCWHSVFPSPSASNVSSETCCWCGHSRTTGFAFSVSATATPQHGEHLP